jgi:hypothetical protein
MGQKARSISSTGMMQKLGLEGFAMVLQPAMGTVNKDSKNQKSSQLTIKT